jgi:hypothetical protein
LRTINNKRQPVIVLGLLASLARNHVAVSFDDPELEKARAAAQAATPAPVNKAALEYMPERYVKRDRIADIPFSCGGPKTPARAHILGFAFGRSAKPLNCEQWHGTPGLANYSGATTSPGEHQRCIPLTISSAVTIQAHIQGLER